MPASEGGHSTRRSNSPAGHAEGGFLGAVRNAGKKISSWLGAPEKPTQAAGKKEGLGSLANPSAAWGAKHESKPKKGSKDSKAVEDDLQPIGPTMPTFSDMILAKHNKIAPSEKLVDIESPRTLKEGTYVALPGVSVHTAADGSQTADLASIFGVIPPPSVYSAAPAPSKSEILQQQVFRDLSSRAAVFRDKIIEEFRLKDEILEENSENAPQYSSAEVVRDEKLMTKILLEKPMQLVRFKIFKRSAESKDQKVDRRLIRVRNINTVPLGVWASWLVESKSFNILINVAILINCVMMGIQTELRDEDWMMARVLTMIDYHLLIIFAIEIFLKWIDNFENFWKSGWNIFDFLVTFLSIIPEIIVAASGPTRAGEKNVITVVAKQIRIFRVFRTFKVVTRFRNLRIIVRTILDAFGQFGYIALLLMLLFYLYAVFGVASFSSYTDSVVPGLNYQHKFSNFGTAMLTLFQLLTLDQWYSICMEISHYTLAPVTIVYFMTWVWIGAFIFRNIFIGVMVRNFRAISEELAAKAREEAKKRKLERMLKKLNQRFKGREGATAPGEGPKLSANLLEALNQSPGGAAGAAAGSGAGSDAGGSLRRPESDPDAPASESDEDGKKKKKGGKKEGGAEGAPHEDKSAKLAAWVQSQEPGPAPPMTDRTVAAEREAAKAGADSVTAAIAAQAAVAAAERGSPVTSLVSGALASLGPDAESFGPRPTRRGSVQFGGVAPAASSSDPALGKKRGGLKKAPGAAGTPTNAPPPPPPASAPAAAPPAAEDEVGSPAGVASPAHTPPRTSPVPPEEGGAKKEKKAARFGFADDERRSGSPPPKKAGGGIRFGGAGEDGGAGHDDADAGAGATAAPPEDAAQRLSKLSAAKASAEGIDAYTYERWAREQDDIEDVIATISAYKKETLWPRDTLFAYLQAMESLMEVVREHEELSRLASMALINLHDTD